MVSSPRVKMRWKKAWNAALNEILLGLVVMGEAALGES